MKHIYLFILFIFTTQLVIAQCPANTANIYSFTYASTNYEIIKENKTWTAAAACAVARGGYLAEINTAAEQAAIFAAAGAAGIVVSNTVAPDGGGASYLWIGGNDITTEGTWVWDGNNDLTSTAFYMGTGAVGAPVGGAYNNWGSSGFGAEPDDFGASGQDGLGLAITNWPLGTAGQWNDVNDGNSLYYIIEGIPVPFAVEIFDFKANVLNESVEIKWSATEVFQNDFFEIERSTDGIHFDLVTKIRDHSFNNSNENYEYLDVTPILTNKVYYRLKAVSQDGNATYSNIISVKFNLENSVKVVTNSVKVVTNSGSQHASFYFRNLPANGELIIYNSLGELINKKAIEKNTQSVQVNLDSHTGLLLYRVNLFSGNYLLQTYTGKFIKH